MSMTLTLADGRPRKIRASSASARAQVSQGAADYLRVASAIAIVWHHTPGAPNRIWCGAALGIFIILSFTHASQPAPFLTVVRRRARRILVPWAFWWVVYAAVAIRTNRPMPKIDSAWSLLSWPSAHLWYMPFLYFNAIAVQASRPLFRRIPTVSKGAIALAVGLGLILVLPTVLPGLASPAAWIWIASLPGACFGVAMGRALRRPGRDRAIGVGLIVVCTATLGLWLEFQGFRDAAFGYAVGAPLTALCALPIPRSRLMTRLALLTPGIYLIHPFAFLFVWKFAPQPASYWLFFLVGVLGSGILAWALKRYSWTRSVV